MSDRNLNVRHSRVCPSPGRGSAIAYSPCPRSDSTSPPQGQEMLLGNVLAIPMSAIKTDTGKFLF